MKKIFLFLILLTGCGKPLPVFDNMDLSRWRQDRNGCQGERLAMLEPLKQQLEKIKKLSEDDVLKLLGRPDQNELWKRNQKFYHYFLEPSAKCNPANSNARKLTIRFNATNLAKEVEIE